MNKNIFNNNMIEALNAENYRGFCKLTNNILDAARNEYQEAENACIEWENSNNVPEFIDDIPEYEELCNAENTKRIAWEKMNEVTEKMQDLFFALQELNKYMGE